MNEVDELREQRVRNGSRRKRDLQAVQGQRFDIRSWIETNLPSERFNPHCHRAVVSLYFRNRPGERVIPTPEAVMTHLRATFKTQATLNELEDQA